MQKKKIEKLIPSALELIPKYLEEKDIVPKVYNGYIASMGAAMSQSGLLPTLAIFSAEKSDSAEGDKRKLLRVLTEMLKETQKGYYEHLGEIHPKKEDRLLRYAVDHKNHPQTLNRVRRDLTDASIALKLSLRTFNLQ